MQGLEMFQTRDMAERFTKHQNNPRNIAVSKAIENIVLSSIKIDTEIVFANLGGRGDTNRYNTLLTKVHKHDGIIHWVNIAPIILEVGKEYAVDTPYASSIEFIPQDILGYLNSQEDNSINCIIMRYNLDYFNDLDVFFGSVHKKLKPGGIFVSDITMTNSELRSHSTNARYSYQGSPVPFGQTVTLHDGDSYTIRFFQESGNPEGGLLPNIQTKKYYFSINTIEKTIQSHFDKVFIGDRKKSTFPIYKENTDTELNSIILRK